MTLYKLNLHIAITLILSYMMTTPSLCEFFSTKKHTKLKDLWVSKSWFIISSFCISSSTKLARFRPNQAKPSPATTIGSSCHFWTLTVLNNSSVQGCKHCRLFMSVCLSSDLARIGNEWKKCLSIYTGIYRTDGRTERLVSPYSIDDGYGIKLQTGVKECHRSFLVLC